MVGLILGVILGLTACAPLQFSVNLGDSGEAVREAVVLREGGRAKVAMIDLTGLIADVRTPALLGVGSNPVDEFLERLEKAEEDNAVKAVIVRINSPGGTVVASDVLYDEIRRFRERSGKPVVASMGEVAASGGYYVALACDVIVAQESTITGSVGVILQTVNFSEGLHRIGVKGRAVTSKANKALANPFEPMEEGHYTILQGLVDDMYGRFREKVVAARKGIPADRVDEVTDGRVFTGRQAVELGLVDELGGVREALARAKALADVERASLVKYHDPAMTARTPYARAPVTEESDRGFHLTLFQLDVGTLAGLGSSGAYYLWMP